MVSAEEYKQWRDIIDKGMASGLKKDTTLKKRMKTSSDQLQKLKKVKNLGQVSFADEIEDDIGKRCSS